MGYIEALCFEREVLDGYLYILLIPQHFGACGSTVFSAAQTLDDPLCKVVELSISRLGAMGVR